MKVLDLGLTDYGDALRIQEEFLNKRIKGESEDVLLITEHESVLTLGRLFSEGNVVDPGYFKQRGVKILKTTRGGKITFHCPGQIVLYPVLDLKDKIKDVSFYIDFLQKTVANSLERLGVICQRSSRRGVWVQNKKIAFIGIGIRKWVTFHGVSVNINNDITPFLKINPCGESDIKVTSVKNILEKEIDLNKAKKMFTEQFVSDLNQEYRLRQVQWS